MHQSVIKEIVLKPAFRMVTIFPFYTVMKMAFILSIMSLDNLKPLHSIAVVIIRKLDVNDFLHH